MTSAFFDPLPAMLATFRATHPDVEVVLQELDTHQAARALTDHAIDVALVRHLAIPPGLERRTLLEEEFVLAMPASWDLGQDEPADLASTAGLPWIWLPRHISPDYHDQVVACCRTNGFAPTVTNTAHSIVSQLAMVAFGIGVALVPETRPTTRRAQRPGALRQVRLRSHHRARGCMAPALEQSCSSRVSAPPANAPSKDAKSNDA